MIQSKFLKSSRFKTVYLSQPVYFVNLEKKIVLEVEVNHREDTINYKNENFKKNGQPYKLIRNWNNIKDYKFLDKAADSVHLSAKLYDSYKWLSDHLKVATNKIIVTKNELPFHDLTTDDLDYNKDTKCFVEEISTLEHKRKFNRKETLIVLNPKTKATQVFTHYKTDTDASQEDIYGWRYKSYYGIELLIIND